jgi:hypothetical protein
MITKELITRAAAPFGFNPDTCYAVARTESGLSGFDAKTGKILIQFEPHVFRRNLPAADLATYRRIVGKANKNEALSPAEAGLLALYVLVFGNEVELQAPEWRAFNAAFRINQEAAIKGASWGAFQILGENHLAAGYADARAMHADYLTGEAAQVSSFLRYCAGHPTPRRVLAAKSPDLEAFADFAQYYNGKNYHVKGYHKTMLKHYLSAKK